MAEGERAGGEEKGRTAADRIRDALRGSGATGFVALGALDKGGVGRSVDEGSGKRVTLRSSTLMVPRRTNRQRGKGRRVRRRREERELVTEVGRQSARV